MYNKKFIVDRNLGKLAKWLIFLGYDTYYDQKKSLKQNVVKAIREDRILLTKNRKISKFHQKFNYLIVKSFYLDNQLKEIQLSLNVQESMFFSRCSECNTNLKAIVKDDLKKKVPEKILLQFDEFMLCPKCNKIYWKGSHYKKIKRKLVKILKD